MPDRISAATTASPQVACDRCSQGVMDTTNDHWLRLCQCECHSRQPELARTPTAVLDASVDEWAREAEIEPCVVCGQRWEICDDCHARPEGED